MNGRFTASQAAAPATAAFTNPAQRPVRSASTKIAPKKNSGYSFVAVPSPMSRPARVGRPAVHAHRARAASITAHRSQLSIEVRMIPGARATRRASRERPRAVYAVATTSTIQQSTTPIAFTSK